MADSPQAARWYVAELTEEVALAGSHRLSLVHRKTRVIFADTPEDAFEKALALSREHERAYLDANEQRAKIRYWSLSEVSHVDERPPAKTPRRRPAHYSKSVELTPAEAAMVMSIMSLSPEALPN
jgi:ferric-dicitrate binding protein FerR (iron transport regulator)